jgi:hypothetical protein
MTGYERVQAILEIEGETSRKLSLRFRFKKKGRLNSQPAFLSRPAER